MFNRSNNFFLTYLKDLKDILFWIIENLSLKYLEFY